MHLSKNVQYLPPCPAKNWGPTPIWQKRHAGNLNSYKSWKFREKISIRFRDTQVRKKFRNSTFLELGEFWIRKIFFEDGDHCCPCFTQISSRFRKISRCYDSLKFFVPLSVMVRKNLKGCNIYSGTVIKNLSFKKLCSVTIYGRVNFRDDVTTFRDAEAHVFKITFFAHFCNFFKILCFEAYISRMQWHKRVKLSMLIKRLLLRCVA